MSKKILIISIIAICLILAAVGIILYQVFTPELTEEQAIAIALEDAGLTNEQVSYVNAHLDHDDGTLVYEIEFREGRTEYDYSVRASDGKILDADWDD